MTAVKTNIEMTDKEKYYKIHLLGRNFGLCKDEYCYTFGTYHNDNWIEVSWSWKDVDHIIYPYDEIIKHIEYGDWILKPNREEKLKRILK